MFDANVFRKGSDCRAEDSVAFLECSGVLCRQGLDDSGEVVAQNERRETPASLGVVVLMFALCVQDVGMLRAAMSDTDEILIG